MNKTIFIKVKTQFEAVHCYPTAPIAVKHLRNKHRHTFFVEVAIEVTDENRQLEFYLVKDYLDTVITHKDLNSLSCEMICDAYYGAVQEKYGKRRVVVEVSEDNQRSAITKYNFKEEK